MTSAILYQMVPPEHTCPFGVRGLNLLREAGYKVDDHVLQSRAEVDAYEREMGVETTPQVFIDGERIGGSGGLERHLAGKG